MHIMTKIELKKLLDNICSKYQLSKTQLSVVLGWGEKNLYKYYNGSTPNPSRLDLLISIDKNPYLFMEYLEKNKNLISIKAYEKSKKSLKKEMISDSADMKKIKWILNFFLSYNKELSPMGLKILFYYTQGFIKALIKKEVPDLKIGVSKNGIEYPQLEFLIEEMCTDEYKESLENKVGFDFSSVNILESIMIEVISRYLSCYSNLFLKKMLYENETVSMTVDIVRENEVILINSKRIDNFFEHIVAKYNMSSPEDISKYIKDIHEKNIFG